jgi:hypothetical protein
LSSLNSQKPFDFDLEEGFSWYAVIKVDLEKNAHPGRKIIAQWLDPATHESISVGLDDGCTLRAWLNDKNRQGYVSDGVEPAHLKLSVLLTCEFVATGSNAVRVVIETNFRGRVDSQLAATMSRNGSFNFSIGADASGHEAAAFTLAEMFIVKGVADRQKKAQLWRYVEDRYGLKREP